MTMTVKQGDEGWVRATFNGMDFEEYPRYSVRGKMIPDSPALPAVAAWLAEYGVDGLRLVIPKALEMLDKYDNRRAWADAITGLRALLAALEQPA